MGYTHYWRRRHTLHRPLFRKLLRDVAGVLLLLQVHHGMALRGPNGDPVLTEERIALHLRPRTDDCSCDDFVLPRVFDARGCEHESGYYFDCCKTAYKPYDLAVQCVLIIAKHHLGDAIIVSSDGREQHWREARDICQQLFGYGEEFVLEG